ncbi:MAG: hemolysin family protein [Victivallaceae bacterium]|nr:hemolysin family protein [Victivallaceae bacterium]
MDIFTCLPVQLSLLVVFLFLSAVFSGAETALFSLSRARLLHYRESKDRRRRAITRLMESYSYTLIVLIFGNMLVNTALALTSDGIFHRHLTLDPVYRGLITVVFAVVVLLIFGEVMPKTIALMYSHEIADRVALPILYLRRVFFPLLAVMDKIFTFILRRSRNRQPRALNSEEYSTYIEMSVAAGAFSQPERELLEAIFGLRRIIAEDIMTVRVNLAPIRRDTAPEAVAARIKKKQQEFFPIVSKDIDDAEQILFARDFFLLPPEERPDWSRKCTFQAVMVPANASLTNVHEILKEAGVPAALVVDEYGRTTGMISARDIAGQITGEVETVYDKAEYSIEKAGDNCWIVHGMIPLFEFERAFSVSIPEGYESHGLNGLFGEILGHLPRVGDTIDLENIRLVVRKVRNNLVTEVKAEKLTTGNKSMTIKVQGALGV